MYISFFFIIIVDVHHFDVALVKGGVFDNFIYS